MQKLIVSPKLLPLHEVYIKENHFSFQSLKHLPNKPSKPSFVRPADFL